MTDQYAKLREALSLFDTAAQAHGWASDMGTQTQAKTAFMNYQRARSEIQTAVDTQASEADPLRKTLDDMAAGIPARDAEIAALRGERDAQAAEVERLREAPSMAEGELSVLGPELERIHHESPNVVATLPLLNILPVVRAALSQGEQG